MTVNCSACGCKVFVHNGTAAPPVCPKCGETFVPFLVEDALEVADDSPPRPPSPEPSAPQPPPPVPSGLRRAGRANRTQFGGPMVTRAMFIIGGTFGVLVTVVAVWLVATRGMPAMFSPRMPTVEQVCGEGGEPRFRATFPGTPTRETILGLEQPTTAYTYSDGRVRWNYRAWVWAVPPENRTHEAGRGICARYAVQAFQLKEGNPPNAGEHWVGPAAAWVCEEEGRLVSGGGDVAVRVLLFGDRVYVGRVEGRGVRLAAPAVRAFLDSIGPEPAASTPATLRQFARMDPYLSAAFAPDGKSVYMLRDNPNLDRVEAIRKESEFEKQPWYFLTQYEYPSFRVVGDYALPPVKPPLAVNPSTGRLYLIARAPGTPWGGGWWYRVHAYAPPANGVARRVLAPAAASDGAAAQLSGLACSPDGRSIYTTEGRTLTAWSAVRRNAETLANEGETSGQKADELLVAADGRTVYSRGGGDRVGTIGGTILAIDAERWQARPEPAMPHLPGPVRVRPDGSVVCAMTDPTRFPGPHAQGGTVVVAGLPVKPSARLKHVSGLALSQDGRRGFAGGNSGAVWAFDVDRLVADNQFHLLGEGKASADVRVDCLSPDGKCLFTSGGYLFWVDQSEPPEVDTAVKWKP